MVAVWPLSVIAGRPQVSSSRPGKQLEATNPQPHCPRVSGVCPTAGGYAAFKSADRTRKRFIWIDSVRSILRRVAALCRRGKG